MLWRNARVKVANGRWWSNLHQLLDDGQVFVVTIQPGPHRPWTTADVEAALVLPAEPGAQSVSVIEVQKAGSTLPVERRKWRGGHKGAGTSPGETLVACLTEWWDWQAVGRDQDHRHKCVLAVTTEGLHLGHPHLCRCGETETFGTVWR